MSNTDSRAQTRSTTIDMSRSSSTREVSKQYIVYLHEWDRRLKKSVNGPSDDATPHPGNINGVRVVRKGRGVPPVNNREQLWTTHGRKEVPGKSHSAHPNLLEHSEAPKVTEEKRPMTVDETRTRFARKITNRFNQSSLSGCGAVVKDEVSTEYKQWRNSGAANPGWGISDNMAKTMSHSCEPDEASLRANQSLVWAVANRPNTCDSIIRHRYDDPTTEAQPALLGERIITPALRNVNTEESRSCFLSSLNDYASNKVRGHYGTALSTGNTIKALAGL